MGFIFGLLVGAALSSGGGSSGVPPSLAQIPLRCFAAVEQSDDAYKACRRTSMRAEITQQFRMFYGAPDGQFHDLVKDINQQTEDALTFEAMALHELADAAKAQKEKQ